MLHNTLEDSSMHLCLASENYETKIQFLTPPRALGGDVGAAAVAGATTGHSEGPLSVTCRRDR